MNEAQKFLIENNLNDIVLNAKQYSYNTPENAKKWIYLSDVLEKYLSQKQKKVQKHKGVSAKVIGCKSFLYMSVCPDYPKVCNGCSDAIKT